jgi:hypothetical protein
MNNLASSIAFVMGPHVLSADVRSERDLQHLLAIREAERLERPGRLALSRRLLAAVAGFREERGPARQRACQDCAPA